MSEIKNIITFDWAPGIFPTLEYGHQFVTEEEPIKLKDELETAQTAGKYGHVRYYDVSQRDIQSFIKDRYSIKFVTTESFGISLLKTSDNVKITPSSGTVYSIKDIDLVEVYHASIKLYQYTMTYTKITELGIATYLSNDVVEQWYLVEPSTNFVNRINFSVFSAPYVDRSAIWNAYDATVGYYNFRFPYKDEYEDISVDDKFYMHYNDTELQIDYRVLCSYIDTEYVYFKIQSYPIFQAVPVDTTEITINSNFSGVENYTEAWLDSQLTVNQFSGTIYTFLKSKGNEITDQGETTSQIQGINQYQKQQFYKTRTFLVYLKTEELYLVNYLSMAEPKWVSYVEFNKDGTSTIYYPITMDGIYTKNERADLNELHEYQITITYSNLTVNTNRNRLI